MEQKDQPVETSGIMEEAENSVDKTVVVKGTEHFVHQWWKPELPGPWHCRICNMVRPANGKTGQCLEKPKPAKKK